MTLVKPAARRRGRDPAVAPSKAAGHPPAGRDAGTTLLEVMVGMAIMSVFMVMFTAGVLQLYQLTNRTEATATAQSQINIAVTRLDKEIRYAAAIGQPGCSDKDAVPPCVLGDPYRFVEYLTADRSGKAICVQLRMTISADPAGGTLQRRSWTQGKETEAVADEGPPEWTNTPVLIAGINALKPFTSIPEAAPDPFTLLPTEPGVAFQRLRLRFSVTSGAGQTATAKETDTTVTALNSRSDKDTTTCTEGREIP